jgi:hypothetical protein
MKETGLKFKHEMEPAVAPYREVYKDIPKKTLQWEVTSSSFTKTAV